MTFEEAIDQLEKITERLEEGNLPLEKSLEQFEQGMKLVQFCEQKLEEVEKRIRVLVEEDGKLKLRAADAFEAQDESIQQSGETRQDTKSHASEEDT
jgi:exodeoxyribonuclease VII small subunit